MTIVDAADPVGIRRVVAIAHQGPHGLDLGVARRRVFCPCDAGVPVEVDADTGRVVAERRPGRHAPGDEGRDR